MEEFVLRDHEYIELNNLLKVLGLCDTGGMAKASIAEGAVRVNGSVELRKRRKIRKDDTVEFGDRTIVVTTGKDSALTES